MNKVSRQIDANTGVMFTRHWDAGREQTRLLFNILTYALLLIMLALRLSTELTAGLSYVALAPYALCGRLQALRALAMSWLFTVINPGLAPDVPNATILRYAVLVAAAFSMLARGNQVKPATGNSSMVVATILLGLFLVLHSYYTSPVVGVSVMKALLWAATMAVILSAWNGLTQAARDTAAGELFAFLVLILLLSLPLISQPVGYLRNGTGFQGILNHPQGFGPTMALLGAWVAARLLAERRTTLSAVGLLGLSFFALLLSEARTAGLAMVLGVGFSVIAQPIFSGRPMLRLLSGLRSPILLCAFLAALAGGLVLAPRLADSAEQFLSKSGRQASGSVIEIYDTSRGFLIDQMTYNIVERPFLGSGFGIASDPTEMEVIRDPILGLPIGAAVEKGVLPLAIVEEVGVFGALLVGTWLIRVMRNVGRGRLPPFAVIMTGLILNFGEATFFSPGGHGLMLMLLLGWAFASGRSA